MLKWMILNVTSAIIIAKISNFMYYFYFNLNTLKIYVVIVLEVGVGFIFHKFY
jgi:hypothetical protein